MLIGHLPAGYVVSKLTLKRLDGLRLTSAVFLFCGMLGAVFPDFDLFYYYLADHKRHHHHSYFTHFPSFWLLLLGLSLLWFWGAKNNGRLAAYAAIFSLNGFIHMLLDSIVGRIEWLAPWDDTSYGMFTLPAIYKHWWLDHFLHWSFALELGLVVWALALWVKSLHRNG